MDTYDFDTDLLLDPKRSERKAWFVALGACGLSVILAIIIIVLLPLKSTEVFTVLVDRTTGQAEKIMQVQPTGIADEEAVKQALLVSYINDRESYFVAGIQERLESVQRRSDGTAARSLTELWTDRDSNEDYPPRIYGSGAEVSIVIKSINFLEPLVAQVRFQKTLRRNREDPLKRSFVATVGFDFQPRQERRLERVWENPLGFRVTDYRVDAETLGE